MTITTEGLLIIGIVAIIITILTFVYKRGIVYKRYNMIQDCINKTDDKKDIHELCNKLMEDDSEV